MSNPKQASSPTSPPGPLPRGRFGHKRELSDGPPKEKKRVGFTGGQTPGQDEGLRADGGGSVPSGRSPDYDPFGSPKLTQEDASDYGPEPAALRRALTKILITEAEDEPDAAGPSRPRPVLRRNTSYDVPEERVQADIAEKLTPQRQHRSGVEARQRADRLAVSVESYSSPSSRRGSADMSPDVLLEEEENENGDFVGNKEAVTTAVDSGHLAIPTFRARPRKQSQSAAENLVRTHTRRARRGRHEEELFRFQEEGAYSRPGTPTEEQAYIQDYVPRPKAYKRGILGFVLDLYRDDTSGDNSGRTTPLTATPNPSPPTSAPGSRASSRSPQRRPFSAPGTPKKYRQGGGGFFGYPRPQGSRSTLSLTELLKSTSTLVAPGSGDASGGVSDKTKQGGATRKGKLRRSWSGLVTPPKEKKKRNDEVRITKHIAEIMARHKYLVKLCRALMMYGAPTHRLEEYMAMSARVLEIEGQFLYLPGCMIISFDDSHTHTTEVKIVRSHQDVDLGRLRDVHELYKEVVHDHMGADEAITKLDEIMARRPKFHKYLRVIVYGLASACVAPFAFQGRPIDMPIAFILGCLLGWLQLILASSNELYANVFQITAAIATSFLARAFGSIRGGDLFCFSALAQSSIALILPGYMVLCSSLELQSHKMVAGSVRMVYAMIYTLFLGYGITIGTALYGLIDREGATSETTCRHPLDRRWHLLFVPAFTLCLCVVNQAKWKQTPVMLVISLLGFVANSYSSDYFKGNTQISNMLGALVVGLLANLYSRLGPHVAGFWFKAVCWYGVHLKPKLTRFHHKVSQFGHTDSKTVPQMFRVNNPRRPSDEESRPGSPASSMFRGVVHEEKDEHEQEGGGEETDEGRQSHRKTVGYGLAAAAMLPAIFVQVPSGLAAGGSLLVGVTSADQITSGLNSSSQAVPMVDEPAHLNGSAFRVLFAVIQVAISITVGLFLSALLVYPFGKRRSGLLSF